MADKLLTPEMDDLKTKLEDMARPAQDLQGELDEISAPIQEYQGLIRGLTAPYLGIAMGKALVDSILNKHKDMLLSEVAPSAVEVENQIHQGLLGKYAVPKLEVPQPQVDESALTYIDKLAFYVPIDFGSEENNQFRSYYISAFIDNHRSNNVQLAYLCFHIVFMTSIYKQFWLLKTHDTSKVEPICRQNNVYDSFNNFFDVSSDSEKNYINHIMGILGFDRNQKKKVTDLVDIRDQCAHAYGEIYYKTIDDIEHYYKEALKWTEKIQSKTQSELMTAFYKKISCVQDSKNLLSNSLTVMIVKELKLSQFDCKTIVDKYQLSELKEICVDFNEYLHLSMIMVVIRLYDKLERSMYADAYMDSAESFKLSVIGDLIKNIALLADELEDFQISVENELTLCKDEQIISKEAFDELISFLNNKILEQKSDEVEYDFFISYAKEDEETIVNPLVDKLKCSGAKVWIDSTEISLGDNIRKNIDKGLSLSKFGVVILSKHYFAKSWTNYEFDALMQRQLQSEKVILPIWHNISLDDVKKFSPTLLNIAAIKSSSSTIDEITQQLINTLV